MSSSNKRDYIKLDSGRILEIPVVSYDEDFSPFVAEPPKKGRSFMSVTGVPGTGWYTHSTYMSFRTKHSFYDTAGKTDANPKSVEAKKDQSSKRAKIASALIYIVILASIPLFIKFDVFGYGWGISIGVFMLIGLISTLFSKDKQAESTPKAPMKESIGNNQNVKMQLHIHAIDAAWRAEADTSKKQVLEHLLNAFKVFIPYHNYLYAAELLHEEIKEKPDETKQSDLDSLIQKMTPLREALIQNAYDIVASTKDEKRIEAYKKMINAFTALANSQKKYKVVYTGEKSEDGVDYVERKDAFITFGMCNFLFSPYDVPTIEFDSDYMCYFYPDFVVIWRNTASFTCKSYENFNPSFNAVRFHEEIGEDIPSDGEVLESTNESIIVKYGRLDYDDKCVQVSAYNAMKEFFDALQNYRKVCYPHLADKTNTATAVAPAAPSNLTEMYFNSMHLEVLSLYKFLSELVADTNYVEFLKKARKQSDITKKDIANLTLSSLAVDFLKILKGLKHEYKENSREILPMLMLFSNCEIAAISYKDVEGLYKDQSIALKYYNYAEEKLKQQTHESFWVDNYLEACQLKDFQVRYRSLMYKIASLIAKADNVVTDDEKQFLASIVEWKEVSASNNNTTSTVPAIKEESPENDAEPSFLEKKDPLADLDNLVGLQKVKDEVKGLYNLVAINKERERKGLRSLNTSYHCIFTGNPGTGKTTVARILANIFKELGVLKKGHLIETDRSGLVAEYVGQTATKTNEIVDSALDGVLFIDEAYALVQGGDNDYGKEAIAALLKRIEDDRDRLIVILAGYSNEMEEFLEINPGMKSRFNRFIDFPDYNAAELYQIFLKKAEDCDCHLTEKATIALKEGIEDAVAHKDKHFGNARFVRNCFEKAVYAQTNRLAKVSNLTENILSTIDVQDIQLAFGIDPNAKPEESKNALEQLRSMIGLAKVKEDIQNLYDIVRFNQLRKQQGFDPMRLSYHCVFTGNPGTGKTTVARIVADIYQELGILKKGHLVETDRSGLVAEYVGQTAIKTNKIIDSALDGVLFIDEAYTLAEGGNSDYGKEAIATLLKRMEDDRHRLVVILAGYTNEMSRFMEANSGLQSRFNRYIEFPDYTVEELCKIFLSICEKNKCILRENAKVVLQSYIAAAVAQKDEKFGNGRFVRNLYEQVFMMQAQRVSALPNPTQEDLLYIEEEDILKATAKNK